MLKNEKQIIISTEGEDKFYIVKINDGRSIDFVSPDNPDKSFASIVDFSADDYVLLSFDENGQFNMEKKPYKYGIRWCDGFQDIRPGLRNQVEAKMKTDKTFIFREAVYDDINSNGLTLGFSYEGSVNLFCRFYAKNGALKIQFADGGSDEV